MGMGLVPGDRGRRILLLILVLMFLSIQGQKKAGAEETGTIRFTDNVFKKTWVLVPERREVMIQFRPGVDEEEAMRIARSLLLTERKPFDPRHGFGVFGFANEAPLSGPLLRELREQPEVVAAMFPRIDQDGFLKYFLPGELTVQFNNNVSFPRMMEVLQDLETRVIRDQWTPGYFTVSVPPGETVFSAMERIGKTKEILFCEPSYFSYNDDLSPVNDPLFSDQWHLMNTGQLEESTASSDMNVPQAWSVTTGDPDVVIAVIDTGIDLSHPDLVANILPRNGEDWNFASTSEEEPTDVGNHGTACNGIVAAVQENGIGVSGVAPGCSLMPLKIDLVAGANANRADAINYAASRRPEFKAMILSLSWRMSIGDFTAVGLAVRNAWEADCIILAASGNDNGPISYPAKYPEVIAVGATTPCDERKSPTSCDGETFWGSSFGPQQEVVAPGVRIVTTDRVGASGYSSTDYTMTFNGTSAACPAAAGVMGLIYSTNPNLTNEQARSVLRYSASDEVGVAGEDLPGFDPFMGYGRVDAENAVRLAHDHPFLTADDLKVRDQRFGNGNEGFDPGEFGTMDLTVQNRGTGDASDVIATLVTDRPDLVTLVDSTVRIPGVEASARRTEKRAFSFIVSPEASCGAELVLEVHLEYQGIQITREFPSFIGSETQEFFDDLESGGGNFTTSSPTGNGDWNLLEFGASRSPVHSWFTSDVAEIKEDRLILSYGLLPQGALLSFWHLYFTEDFFDGGVIEISTDGLHFEDLGPFIRQGEYDRTLSSGFGNPLEGRNAWTGSSGSTMSNVLVDLSSFFGNSVTIRWRFGCDSSQASDGWYVDDISILTPDCETFQPEVGATLSLGTTDASAGDSVDFQVILSNPGFTRRNVQIKISFLLPGRERLLSIPMFSRWVQLPETDVQTEDFQVQLPSPLPTVMIGEILAVVRVTNEDGRILSVDGLRFVAGE